MPEEEDPDNPGLSHAEQLILAVGIVLAVVPSLPLLQSDAVLFVRFHNWSIFVGGLLTGAIVARARERLAR